MKNRSSKILSNVLNLNTVFWFLALITIAVSVQQLYRPDRYFWEAMRPMYNNFLIFKYSFSHLADGLNLYALYPEEHGDYFKYSPTFALFMAPLSILPNWLGIVVWNLVSLVVFYASIRLLPGFTQSQKLLIILFTLPELVGNFQNEQTNALMAGFILLTFISFEKKHIFLAALFVALGLYLKLFGILAAVLFVFYPNKLKFIAYSIFWVAILWLLPLLVITPAQLVDNYSNWLNIVLSDHGSRYGFSILGILNKWFGLEINKLFFLLFGAIILIAPLIRIKQYEFYSFRLLYLASMLIWVILFNHTAEASGYILAMTGGAIWYFSQKRTILRIVLIVLAFVVVSLFSTDIMPAHIRNEYIYPYYLRTLPVLLIWTMTLYEMSIFKKTTDSL